ncbi:MAG TPA: T9SS type A sorting domain-containing protein [Tenuifilaceae bacterium]|nr:T9SS type A sorting domain-containing protein [Tenuifilaceae bacterium]HPE19443.1 T9SS type A sorting domain-containing protein [Tenuifilaceae bacterium]HPJ47120.1 T9SS type A sorting domain-containing protein [Tenuifilaceae bacterium]HPQ35274.1 T9SS type A sorting domain-containing protein [Tenuifilaceae bacterium]HRX69021.1 T9SS type A sorting domain-containing protein [Tenuifilaceae bacterium]
MKAKLFFVVIIQLIILSHLESRGSDFWEGILSTTSTGQHTYAIVNNEIYQLNNKDWVYKSYMYVDGLMNLIVANNDDIYAVYSNFINKSVDEGISWVNVPTPVSETIYGAKIIGDNVFLKYYQKVYRGTLSSENITWELIYQGDYYDITMTQNNNMYITPGMLKSTDNGNTWVQTNWPDDVSSTPYVLNHYENTVFVGTYWEGILYSDDGGNTWHRSAGLPEGRGVNGVYLYNNQVFARVGDQKGVLGLYMSTNNGASFNKCNTGLSVWVEQHLSGLSSSGNNLYISVGKRGFFYSDDSGNSWQDCNNGENNIKPHNVQQIQVEEDGTIWVLMAPVKTSGPNPSYGVLKSVDRGVTWIEADKELWEEYMTLEDILVTKEGKAFVANYNPGTINFSIDGGISWTNQAVVIDGGEDAEEGGIQSTIDILRANNSNDTIFAGTYWDGIIRSVNGGASWTKLTNGLPSNTGVWDISIDNNSIFAIISSQAGYDGVYISNDGGDSWTKISSKFLQRITKSDDILYGYGFSNELGYYTNVFYISNDNGQTWSYVTQGLPSTNIKIYDILITPNPPKNNIEKQLLMATNEGLYQLNLDNNTFSKVSNDIIFTLFWDIYNNEIILGKENGIAITTDISLNINETSFPVKHNPILYPNPFSALLQIETSLDYEVIKEVQVFDFNGRQLESYHFNSTSESINLSYLNSGAYFVRILTSSGAYYEKVIKF